MKPTFTAIIGLGLLASLLPAGAQPPGTQPPGPRPSGAPPPGIRHGVTNGPQAPATDFSKIFKDDKERNGYAIGMSYGKPLPGNLTRSEVPFDADALIAGFTDGIKGNTNRLTDAQVQEIIHILQREMRARQAEKQKEAEEKRKAELEKNKKAGEEFLAKKKTEPGVIPLPSGLMYKVIKQGTGDSPKATDQVMVNYKGTLIDGTEFDSSYPSGKPTPFRVDRLVKGWTEALELMKPGAKWELYIPADLAYGDHGSPPKIPPGSTLVFDVELVSVVPGPAAAAPPPPSAPLTSDIIKVPSAEELKKGAKIETIKPEDIEKERLKEAAAQTNAAKTGN